MSESIPVLSRGERALAVGAALLAGGVGGLGLASSFDAVSAAAARWGFSAPWMVPVGIDVAIPVFTVANLLLIRMGMPLAWVRFAPWVLTGVTCWLNIAAGHSLSAKIAHGTMPLLWVVLSEVAAHIYASRIGAVTGARMERIRRSRWLLSPVATFALWRRMVLWETTSYHDALVRERERLLLRAELRERHGRRWRRKAPVRTRVLLRLGELAPTDATPDTPQPDPEPEPERPALPPAPPPSAPEPEREAPKRKPRATGGRKGRPQPKRSFEELLAQARETTADWPVGRLTAETLRTTLRCSPVNARRLREALKADRSAAEAEAVAA
ncbi:DUF2637 domain-containing protein [Streptomyces sp. WMMC897]|uniref:DUF2637 domain-containing protein n=1 Tax=Streptomyces sp. WMMC897 TaxID=3014782 RepID=UPI0022B632D6|nr:DUF2637 domain-containing protein [Streptomyces sp. WMMC897]MCZ7415674.1 DUF2637 domain-containing protein [Streptomyces sp. WMMC897]